jgi:predicted hotdog family 3-hydroxylacyl-ACP dehydratase
MLAMANSFPPIEVLIPHRGTMLLLDRVVDFRDEMAIAEYTPRREAWYVDAAGDMPAWIGIELMAQTVAALVALSKQREGLPLKMGVLLGSRRYRASAACFASGRALRIRAEMRLRDPGGMGAYECAIESGGKALATAMLKVYEPDDFNLFVQGSL